MKCILLETKDKRRFLTAEKNLNKLKEFIKIFEIKISIVESEEKLLSLTQLVSVFCGTEIKKQKIKLKKK
ncbi:MAG: hypothetical protein EKK64_10450 [Neisseriaceae bacterium]|nr:MAG: hypothetical protein EKK64_10450 [Neisseriaceae bacterium]